TVHCRLGQARGTRGEDVVERVTKGEPGAHAAIRILRARLPLRGSALARARSSLRRLRPGARTRKQFPVGRPRRVSRCARHTRRRRRVHEPASAPEHASALAFAVSTQTAATEETPYIWVNPTSG